jgi:hypothetical protein
MFFANLVVTLSLCVAADDPDADLFTKRIQPVLKKQCYQCHSAEADEVKGDLRLDTPEGITKGGNNGPLVKPGDTENSFLLRVIRYQEDDYQMPPRGKMPDNIIQDFEAWVKAGAVLPKKK